jgi:hypothetical protein
MTLNRNILGSYPNALLVDSICKIDQILSWDDNSIRYLQPVFCAFHPTVVFGVHFMR